MQAWESTHACSIHLNLEACLEVEALGEEKLALFTVTIRPGGVDGNFEARRIDISLCDKASAIAGFAASHFGTTLEGIDSRASESGGLFLNANVAIALARPFRAAGDPIDGLEIVAFHADSDHWNECATKRNLLEVRPNARGVHDLIP